MANLLKRRLKKLTMFLSKVLIAIAIIYVLICLALWSNQRKMMFFPNAILRNTPADFGLAYEDVWLMPESESQNGQVHGWWIPNQFTGNRANPVILFLHGNASNIGDMVSRAQTFHQWGVSTLLIDYRGYGRSSGPFPGEQQVYEDAEAAWQYLVERGVSADRIVIYGQSIGGAIAINLAANHPEAAGLVVESSFTSMREMVRVQKTLPLIPVNWLLTQRFESLEKVRSLQMPLLFIHGTADRVVPVGMSEQLYDAAPNEKTRVLIEGAGHNDSPLVNPDLYWNSIRTFIEQSVT